MFAIESVIYLVFDRSVTQLGLSASKLDMPSTEALLLYTIEPLEVIFQLGHFAILLCLYNCLCWALVSVSTQLVCLLLSLSTMVPVFQLGLSVTIQIMTLVHPA